MNTLGICTTRRHPDELNYETRRLYDEASRRYDSVRLIDPRAVVHAFVRGEARPRIDHRGEDISALTTLVVRSTTGREAATAMLARALKLCGCDVLDPVERFAIGKASKLLTTIERFRTGAGTSTYVTFGREGGVRLLDTLARQQQNFALVIKPAHGRKGRGVYLIEDLASGLRHLDEHFGPDEYGEDPFFLQDRVVFTKEYRILVVDGEALGIVEKIGAPGVFATNAALGARFVAAAAPGVIEAALPSVSKEGILGVDVGLDAAGEVHVIEANRAPEWSAFEAATGLNVARLVVERAIERVRPSPAPDPGLIRASEGGPAGER